MCADPICGTMFEQKRLCLRELCRGSRGVQISLPVSGCLELAASRTDSLSSLWESRAPHPQSRDHMDTWHLGSSASGARVGLALTFALFATEDGSEKGKLFLPSALRPFQ